jgi:hypothetical protein
MVAIPTTIPATITAGSTVKFTQSLPDYLPADGWVLSYALVMAGKIITWSGTDNGDGQHLINVNANGTKDYAKGIYNWQSYVTKGGDRFDIASDVIEVKPNFATQNTGYDARSDVKITLDNITAVLKGTATKEQLEYTVAGRTLKLRPLPELIMLHKRYLALYAAEQGKLVKKVLTQF